MRTILELVIISVLLLGATFAWADSQSKSGALRSGDSITVYDLGNGIKSYWDQHGNNMQVYDTGIPGLKNYSTGKSHGQIYEPFHQEPLPNVTDDPLPTINSRLKRCPPEVTNKVYCD